MCVGHYVTLSKEEEGNSARCIVEVKDKNDALGRLGMKENLLPGVLAKFLPHPVRFQLVSIVRSTSHHGKREWAALSLNARQCYLLRVANLRVLPACGGVQVWSEQGATEGLHVWKAVAGSAEHVALGMVATVGPQTPPLSCVRCVPR